MESLAAIECNEEGLEMEIMGWLAINDLDRLSNFMKCIGARNMNDIKFISTHEDLLNDLKANAKKIDYYKFINAAELLVEGGTKQCSPAAASSSSSSSSSSPSSSSVPAELDEIVTDVKMTKKRDATTAFADTVLTRVDHSTPSEFSAEDEDAEAKTSFLPQLYPPFIAYKDDDYNGNDWYLAPPSPVADAINIHTRGRYAPDYGDRTTFSRDESSYRNSSKIATKPTTTTSSSSSSSTAKNATFTANHLTTSRITATITSRESFEREKEAFLEKFPIDRCSCIFKTRREMDKALEGLTWDIIYRKYGWGKTAKTSGVVDLLIIRDDCKDIKQKILKKYGLENVHYFNFINGGGRKAEYEAHVVEYFKKSCAFLRP